MTLLRQTDAEVLREPESRTTLTLKGQVGVSQGKKESLERGDGEWNEGTQGGENSIRKDPEE